MPFSRPTLSDLRAQVAQDVTTAVGAGTDLLRRAVLRVVGDAQAGLAHLHYGYLDWIARQSVPFTAEDEALEGWGALKGVTRKAATQASGTATFAGTPGAIIPAGHPVSRYDGAAYTTGDAAAVGLGGTVTVTLTAAEAGAVGNAEAGAAMVLGIAVAGVQSSGIAGALTGGTDAETDNDLRTRMLAAYATTPMGGAQADYVAWALEVPGVTRAWCLPNGVGVGTVIVYVMLDDAHPGGFPVGTDGVAAAETRGTAATGDQLAVANHLWPLAPVTALVTVVAPVAQPVAFTIAGVPVGMRSAVSTALADQLRQDGSPGGTVRISALWAAVRSLGLTSFDINIPSDDITATAGHLPTLGVVTWA